MLLTRAPAMEWWMTSVLAQNRTVMPALVGPSQNCFCATHMFPEAGTTWSNSIGPPDQATGVGSTSGTSSGPVVCASPGPDPDSGSEPALRSLPWPRRQQPVSGQNPVDRPLRRHQRPVHRLLQQLHPDALRTPPRMLPTHLGDLHLHRHRQAVRTRPRPPRPIRQTRDPIDQIPTDPGMQRLPRHTQPPSHLRGRRTRQHRTHRIQPPLDHRQRNQCQSRPPRVLTSHEDAAAQDGRSHSVSSIWWHTSVKNQVAQDSRTDPSLLIPALRDQGAPQAARTARLVEAISG
jgi:hypothetical protein